ncbi:MAG: hypothetical protein ACLPQ6_01520 [Steroidobacteraceae bacterium]|jgi:hypothetical protein
MSTAGPLALLPLLAVSAAGVAAADTPAAPLESGLKACASIAAASERLACYDQLSGRLAPAAAAAASPRTAALAPAPAPAAAQPAAPAAATTPAALAAAAPAPTPPQSFGLYAAEHPAPPPTAQSLTVHVVGLGHSASGRQTVALEGGQVWELVDGDPLLAVGDTVTIRRASLGSFLIETPSRREHRARRLH